MVPHHLKNLNAVATWAIYTLLDAVKSNMNHEIVPLCSSFGKLNEITTNQAFMVSSYKTFLS
jgi:hypothetical protein